MSSALKKKVTVKSEPWYVDDSVIRRDGYQISPRFGTEATKFYWCAEKCGPDYSLHLYLASCQQEKVYVELDLWYGDHSTKENVDTFEGEVSLDKTKTVEGDIWNLASFFTSTEITFEEADASTPKVTQENHLEALSSQLVTFRENSNSADITLVTTVDGREFPVHKWILTLRSVVFAAMFGHGEFKENQAKLVEIEDISGEVMDALLKYLYSADVQGVEKIAGDLLKAADKYDFPLLVEECVQSLLDSLTCDTAAKCFYLADLYRLEDFKRKVVRFIGENRQAVRNSAGWKQFIGHEQVVKLFDLLLP